MQPDIMSQIQVSSSEEFESPSVTVADVGEAQGQEMDAKSPEQQSESTNQEPEVQGEDKVESKTKDERVAEGKRIERKMDKLYKSREEAREAEAKARFELEQMRRELDEYKNKLKETDLDELSFDERIKRVAASDRIEHEYTKQQEQLQKQISEAIQYNVSEKINEAVSKYGDDYYKAIEAATPLFEKIPMQYQQAIINAEHGALVAYEVAKNPSLAYDLAISDQVNFGRKLESIIQAIKANNISQPVAQQQESVQSTPRVMATPTHASAGNPSSTKWFERDMHDIIAMKQQHWGRR